MDLTPLKAIYNSTNIPIESQSGGGGPNILKRINIRPNDTVIYMDDEEAHAIDVISRNMTWYDVISCDIFIDIFQFFLNH